ETLSNLSVKLAVNHFYFDFANDYFRQHPSIASPSTFRITDEDYQAFTQFVLNKGVDYDLQSRKLMDRFKSMLQQEGLYDEVKAEFEALDAKLNSDLAAHLHLFREDITRFIESSIVLRYYYQKGEHEYMLRDDSFLEKAIELLQNNEKYFSILNVDNQIDKQK
ncbi:MAG: peptidase S41, partial [Bacteroidales bacterium]|nr:peptidase S41 [Bacteroidales bacterium]